MKNRFINFKLLLSLFIATLVFTGCSEDEDTSQYYQENITDLAVGDFIERSAQNEAGNTRFTALYEALVKANLLDALNSGEITLLAPSNSAFAAAGIIVSETPAEVLAEVLSYHVIPSAIEAEGLAGAVTSLQGSTFNVAGTCINGVVNIEDADNNVANGVIHYVDGVLMPPTGDIVDKVAEYASAATPEFTILQAAIVRAGLEAEFSGTTRYTVFAPTDAAFEAAGLDIATINALDPAVVEEVLGFHVLAGETFSCAIQPGLVATLAGPLDQIQGVTISTADGVSVNGSVVTNADVLASNGVIHVVDALIEPLETIAQITSISSPSTIKYYEMFRFGEILAKSGITYSLDDDVILYIPTTYAVDSYLNSLGTDVSGLTVAECEEIVLRHTFTILAADIEDGTYIENALGERYLFNSNSDGEMLNLLFGAGGLGTIAADGTIVGTIPGVGTFFLGGGVYDQAYYNGTITTTNQILFPLPTETIVDELVADGNYTALVAAAQKTGLDATLATDNYTIFAPNDAAFLEIGYTAVTINALDPVADADEIAALEATLLKHVTTELLPSTSLLDLGEVELDGSIEIIEEDSGSNIVFGDNTAIESDNAVIENPDVLVANGIIHGIDKVLN